MSNLTPEQKQVYVNIIKKLYGSSIYVDEDMINEEVVTIVHTMLDEIRKCNLRLAIFTTLVNALADTLEHTWSKFGIPDPAKFVEDLLKSDKDIFKNQLLALGEKFLDAFVSHWLDILTNSKQARICVVTAARNYKSPLAMALIGI